jgi:hypothetical protein
MEVRMHTHCAIDLREETMKAAARLAGKTARKSPPAPIQVRHLPPRARDELHDACTLGRDLVFDLENECKRDPTPANRERLRQAREACSQAETRLAQHEGDNHRS